MFAEIEPADVYERVEITRVMVGWLFGVGVVVLVLAVAAGVVVWVQNRKLVQQNRELVQQNSKLVEDLKRGLERQEMWLSLVELHYQRGADQKAQSAEDVKFVKEFLAQAAKDGKLPTQAVAELKAAIHAVPKKVVTEMEKATSDPDSGLRKLISPGTGDSHHG